MKQYSRNQMIVSAYNNGLINAEQVRVLMGAWVSDEYSLNVDALRELYPEAVCSIFYSNIGPVTSRQATSLFGGYISMPNAVWRGSPLDPIVVCECGAAKCGQPSHSTWCPMTKLDSATKSSPEIKEDAGNKP